MTGIGRVIVAVTLLMVGAACRASLDDVSYQCSRERRFPGDGGPPQIGYPYIEEFDEDEADERLPTLRDRCWQTYDTQNANVLPSDSDLVIRPNGRALWTANTRAPSLSQHVERDFVVVTRVEVVNVSTADHCDLEEDDVAGLVARRDQAPAGWLTYTVRPFGVTESNCIDDAPMPPKAMVERKGHGLGVVAPESVDAIKQDIGEDGEAEIALCRQADRLVTFYRDPALVPQWRELGTFVAIGPGSLEIGLTTASRNPDSIEGHFNWAMFLWVGTLPGDGCAGVLESFEEPPAPDEATAP